MHNKWLILGVPLLILGAILLYGALSETSVKRNERGAVIGSFFDSMIVDYTDQFAENGENLLGLIKDKKYDDIEKGYPEFKHELVQLVKELETAHGNLVNYAWQRTQTLGVQSKINNRRAVVAINFYNLAHTKGEYTAIITNCRYFDNKEIEILKLNFMDELVDSDAYDDIIQSIEDSFEQ